MEQIKFVDYKVKKNELVLFLRDKQRVVIWHIPLQKPLKGHICKCMHVLRRSLYDLAYEFTDDPDERNVIMDVLWVILNEPIHRWVWVHDGFLERLDEKYNSF